MKYKDMFLLFMFIFSFVPDVSSVKLPHAVLVSPAFKFSGIIEGEILVAKLEL